MIYPEELVNLFKKHGYWAVSLFLFVVACVSLVLFIVFANGIALVNAVWCSANIYGIYVICKEKEYHLVTKEQLADARDQLCLTKHEVERLTLELETTQAALLKAKAGPVSEEVSAEESSVKEPSPKPKRRPAPRGTRKPKTKNENKD